MSKGKIERPDLKQVKKRAINGWGAHPDHVLWMIDMLEKAYYYTDRFDWEYDTDTDAWITEYGEANGT